LKGLLWELWAVLVERVLLTQRDWVRREVLVLVLVLMQRVPVLVKQRSQGLAG
jgi:hypothetical protein